MVTWFFNGIAVLSNGKVYRDQTPILDTDTNLSIEDAVIKTTLTIKNVSTVPTLFISFQYTRNVC